jgi:hypothetical protein
MLASGAVNVLFEIKAEGNACSIQQAVGQLMLYAELLGGPYEKVLVLPCKPSAEIARALKNIGIRFLEYTRQGSRISFDKTEIENLLQV